MEIKNIAITNLLINIPILVAVVGIWIATSGRNLNKIYLVIGLVAIALSSIIPLPLTNWLMSNHLEIMSSGQAPLIIISSGIGILQAAGLVLLVYSFFNRGQNA